MSAVIEIVPPEPGHVAWIAAHIREADRQEIDALVDWGAEEALRRSVASSFDAWTGTVDGEPVCMFGLSSPSIVSGRGIAWLLGTNGVERNALPFLRRNRAYIDRCLALCPILENWVHVEHRVSIRWLRWLGFSMDDAAPFGPHGIPFHRCELRAAP